MATRQKAISVKIATPKVIKALETALDKLNKDYASQEASEAKYQEAHTKYNEELLAYALANVKLATNVRTNYRAWNNCLNVDFDIITNGDKTFPESPERDFDIIHEHQYREQKEELRNAISMLKMTDEETVNTSTYNAVARYL